MRAARGGVYPDWRLPTIPELRAIVDCSFISPCFRPELGATRSGIHYWSSTSNAGDGSRAWTIISTNGALGNLTKTFGGGVRAVRSAM